MFAIIVALVALIVALVSSSLAVIIFIGNRRKEKKNIQRIARIMLQLRRRFGDHIEKEFQLFSQRIENSLGEAAQKATEDRLPAILTELKTDQKQSVAAMNDFLARETGRLGKVLDLRLGAMEKSMEETTYKTTGIVAKLLKLIPWKHKNGKQTTEDFPAPGAVQENTD